MQGFKLLYFVSWLLILGACFFLMYEGEHVYMKLTGAAITAYLLARTDEHLNQEHEN